MEQENMNIEIEHGEIPTGSHIAPNKKENKLFNFLKKYHLGLIIVLLAAIATGALIYIIQNNQPKVDEFQTGQIPKPKPVYYSKLSEQKVEDEASVTAPVTAIMIENSPDARPQSGLAKAEIVFEAVAEGGITRFLTLWQTNKSDLIGPVRSLRTHYLNWLTPFEASIAHVGGSTSALRSARSGLYRDIDQMANGGSYWRSTDRVAPHNVYTSSEKLDALNTAKGYTESNPEMFARQKPKAPLAQAEGLVKQINITISHPLYDSYFSYDIATNKYLRFQAGAAHLDRENGQIKSDALIVIKTTMHNIPEDGTHYQVNALGAGEAYVFQNGTVAQGTWKKATKDDQIRFYDNTEQEIKINRGQVWITAIQNDSGKVTW